MRRTGLALMLVVAATFALGTEGLARDKKKEEAPPPIEFTVLRDGKPAGTFSYKIAVFSGKVFSSSQLEMKTRKGTLAILTHVEKDGAGKLLKYRKWVGNEGATPDLIAFWKDDSKLRIVSKLKSSRFTKDLSPAKGFEVLDQLGFHLYGDIAELWSKTETTGFNAIALHKGRMDKVTLEDAGIVVLKDKEGKEVTAKALHLRSKGFNLTIFVGDKPRYLGFQSKHVTLVRKGWNLVGVHLKRDGAVPVELKQELPDAGEPAPEAPAMAAPAATDEPSPDAKQPEKQSPEKDVAAGSEEPSPDVKKPEQQSPEKEVAAGSEATPPDGKQPEQQSPKKLPELPE